VPTYIVPYASGLSENGGLDAAGLARCQRALAIAKEKQSKVLIVLGCGMKRYSYRFGSLSLAEAMARFFIKEGWPAEQILINALGYETATETAAALEVIKDYGEGPVIAVTSRHHQRRLWIVWNWGFGYPAKVEFCQTPSAFYGLGWFRLALMEFFGIPFSWVNARVIRSRI